MRYRNKLIIVDAMQVTEHNAKQVLEWCESFKTISEPVLHGVPMARGGDWIIRDMEGEFYVCKPGVFDATYEAVK